MLENELKIHWNWEFVNFIKVIALDSNVYELLSRIYESVEIPNFIPSFITVFLDDIRLWTILKIEPCSAKLLFSDIFSCNCGTYKVEYNSKTFISENQKNCWDKRNTSEVWSKLRKKMKMVEGNVLCSILFE